jgi:hypothetical protein
VPHQLLAVLCCCVRSNAALCSAVLCHAAVLLCPGSPCLFSSGSSAVQQPVPFLCKEASLGRSLGWLLTLDLGALWEGVGPNALGSALCRVYRGHRVWESVESNAFALCGVSQGCRRLWPGTTPWLRGLAVHPDRRRPPRASDDGEANGQNFAGALNPSVAI